MILIIAIWIMGISCATFVAAKLKETACTKLIDMLTTKSSFQPMEDVLEWAKQENIHIDYIGMLK